MARLATVPSNSASDAFALRFSAFLTEAGLLDESSAARALRAASLSGDRFDTVLTKLGILSESALVSGLARYLDMPVHVPGEMPVSRLLPDLLPFHFLAENRVLPVRLSADCLTIAVVDPLDTVPLESVRLVVDRDVSFEIITLAEFERALAALQAKGEGAGALPLLRSTDAEPSENDLQRLRDSASEAPVIRLVEQIIADAVDAHASDIYIEPTAQALRVRYRVDGVLRQADEVPARLRAAIISRVKILARLDIAERRLPQDGRIKLAVRGQDIDFRVATIPTIDGEAVTMRVLDRSHVTLDFPSLGFDPEQVAVMHQLMRQPNGIILVTGPTGSGKTTTLYTMLKHVNRPTAKIFTVEDPIEYQLSGISQLQVQEAIGLDFPAVLRSILRHHPDMIMIGEIRDEDTARIAVQASLTGHLVFSTLHTNSAAESVTRLIDMGIERFLLGSTLRGIVAQRLVRRLCTACSQPHEDASRLADHFLGADARLAALGQPNFRRPVGCESCRGSGYQGQMSIAEMLAVDPYIRDAILQQCSGSQIEDMTRQRGWRSLYDDGVTRAWYGVTTIEEVLRVTNTLQVASL